MEMKSKRVLRQLLTLILLITLSLGNIVTATQVRAEGSRNLTTNGGKRALTEWRTNTTAGLYRRTFFRVYAKAGEKILMGSSAMGVGSGDIVLYSEAQISSSQIDPTTLNSITPQFKCSTYRGQPGNAGAGALDTRAKELAGPQPATGGYKPCIYTALSTGVYWVAMYGPDGANGSADGDAGTIDVPNVGTGQRSGVSMWDITVRNVANTANIPGRVFVDYLAQITGGNGASRRVNSTLYTVTNDGFIYQVDFRGLDPNGFIFYGNRVGFLDPDGKTPLYHDLVTNNNQLTNPVGGVILAPASAKMFFSYPSADLPANILPTPTQPSISNISFLGSASANNAYFSNGGEFTYTGNIGGINQIVISRDGVNFDPTNANNRVLYAQSVVGVNTITWDGKDNAGVAFPVGNDYAYKMTFHAGEYHFPMLDVENSMLGGPTITLLNPIGGTCPLATCRQAFYDDRGYKVSTGVTVGTVGTVLPGDANAVNPPDPAFSDPVTGYDTASTTQRNFGNDSGTGFGNWKGLDLWTYFPVAPIEGTLNVIAQVNQDLRIVKSHSSIFNIGSSGGTFSLLVTNAGTSVVNGQVTVADTLPTGLTYRSATGTDWSCSAVGQTVTCTYVNGSGLASSASLPVITLIVDVANAAAPSVSNTATVANANDTNADNNQYTDTAPVNSADISITKQVSNSNPAEGDQISFTIVATNLGPSDVSGVEVADALPAGLTLVSSSATQGSYASGVWTVGSLPNAASATLTIVATVNTNTAGSEIVNTAGRTASSLYDYNNANDSASVTVTVKQTVLTGIITDAATGTPIVGATVTVVDANNVTWTATTGADGRYTITGLAAGSANVSAAKTSYETGSAAKTVVSGITNVQDLALKNADLVLTKTDSKTTTANGETLVYTIVVQNTGSLAANGVVINDTLSVGLTFISCSPTCSGSGSSYSWTLTDPLAPGASTTLNLLAQVTATLGNVWNYAKVTTTSPESDVTDNENSDIDAILSAPDLKVTITDNQTQVLAGQPLVYNLTYANIGNTDASTSQVTVQVPAGLTVTDYGGGTWDSVARTITWNIGTLTPSASGSLSFAASVDSTASPATVLAATATITDDGTHGTDQDLSNNTASDSDIVIRPDLVLSKSVSSPARLDSPVLVTLSYQNPSAAEARNVTIQDDLPTGTSYVANSCSPACTVNGSQLSWTIASVPAGGSGTLTFQMNLSASAGGSSTSTPTYATESGSGSLIITSAVGASTLKGLWTDDNPVGPIGWQANPVAGSFTATLWSATVAASFESYWLTPSALSAEWVAVNASGQLQPNYTFFRQSACLPLNAAGLSASLDLAGDDVSDIYLNGVFLGNQIGGGGSTHFDGTGAVQPGPNLLAVRLLNNRHGGHAAFSGQDHVGLLYNLSLLWSGYQPFAKANTVILAGQAVNFTADPQALVGQGTLNYRFEFDDGTPQDYSATATASHTYNTPGVYTAVVRARDDAGCTAADTLTIAVLPSDHNLVANTASASYASAHSVNYTTASGTAFDLPLGDLVLSKSSSPNPGVVGEPLTYQLTVHNNGPRTLTSLTLTDPLPSALLSPVYTPSAGSYDPLTGEWTGISLASGNNLTLQITGLVDPLFSGTFDNTASVSSAQASDTATGNNTASDTNPLSRPADLGVTVIGVKDQPSGGKVTFTITVTNNGSSGVPSFSLADVVPAALSNLVYTPNLGEYDPGTNVWSGVTFLSGDVLVLTVVADVASGFKGNLVYPVTVATPTGTTDSVSSNNNASATLNYPTAVTLAAFDAVAQGDAILVTWETASELDNVGFNLYRSKSPDGQYTLLNETLIPPQNPGSVIGAVYEWLDTNVQPGVTYFYKLEDLDVKGVSTFHGPVSTASVTAPTAVQVQSLAARAPLALVALGLATLVGLVFFRRRRRER
ncbi:MAG TPA: PKD domain-containing protein [Anaerolineae bacterium]|nr:PKD domain-containing protein [Anaerolineae bacterium]HQI87070.1 PKD domain-containing protein [Anaerolineae bacterium]